MQNVNNFVLNVTDKNKNVGLVFGMLLVLYAALAAPKLPKNVAKFFDYPLVKLVFMFLIAYLATDRKNPMLALLIAVALLVTIQTAAAYESADKAALSLKSMLMGPAAQAPAPTVAPASPKIQSSVPLSPDRVDFINATVDKAKGLVAQMNTAQAQGDQQKAEVLKQDIAKQEIKIDAAIKAKEQETAAIQAKQNGFEDQAKSLFKAAADQVNKVTNLLNAEAHTDAAQQAAQSGDMNKAQLHADEAAKYENKVIKTLKKEQGIPVSTTTTPASSAPATPASSAPPSPVKSAQTGPSGLDLSDKLATYTESQGKIVRIEEPKAATCSDFKVGGYEGGDYANF